MEREEKEEEETEDTPTQTEDDKGADELLANEYSHYKEKLMSCLERTTGEITTLCSSHLKEMEEKIEKQFQYLHNQVNSTINWRLKQYHAELLKDINSVLRLMASTLRHMEEELTNCTTNIGTLSEEVTCNMSLNVTCP